MPTTYDQMEVDAAIEALKTSRQGLSSSQAALRLREHGPNRLTVQRRTPQIVLFLRQFTGLFAIILLIAAGINALLGQYVDGVVMLAIVVVNAAVGFAQEFKAERVLQSLTKMLAPRARVLRDGEEREIPAPDLVPGDIVVLEEGDAVPADIRLTEEHEIHTNDFALTGEADPKNKFVFALTRPVPLPERDNEVFLGTTVARGNGRGVVIATGMQTEIGRIAQLSQRTNTDLSPLQVEMNLLARRLSWVALSIAVLLYALSLAIPGLTWIARFTLAIGVAASCVPEGLPAQVSVALSLGMKRLAKRRALVKKLSAVETLGSTTVICTDKTGTLTAGQMTIVDLWTLDAAFGVEGIGYEPVGAITPRGGTVEPDRLRAILEIGPLCSTADVRPPDEEHPGWYCMGDPTEGALMTLAAKRGIDCAVLRAAQKEERQFPFDSVRKRMSSVRRTAEGLSLCVKGAPDCLLARCTSVEDGPGTRPLSDADRAILEASIQQAAGAGRRVLGLARRTLDTVPQTHEEAERELTLVGFVAMSDPPRPGVAEALAATRTAGIRTYVLTGDSATTATAIAQQIGLTSEGDSPRVVEGGDLRTMTDEDLIQVLREPSAIFCRVSPEEKLRIVELLKRHGDVVAVTGDGVNDAPALKSAAIGVAMGKSGTDVTKGAAEIILLDDSFTTLVEAVREGRTIFRNLRKTVMASLTSNSGELFATLFGFGIMSAGASLPIQAVQILAIDLLAEMTPLTLLTLDPSAPEIMKEKPRARTEHLVSSMDILTIFAWGALMGAIAVVNYVVFLWLHGVGLGAGIDLSNPILYAQATTMTYLTIGFCQYANILSRRWKVSVFHRQTLANPSVLISMGATMGLIALLLVTPIGTFLHFAPLPLWAWGQAALGGLVFLAVWEVKKLRSTS